MYEFDLHCLPKPSTVINDIKSPLGVSTFIKAEFENPLNKKITLNIFNTNPSQFVLKAPMIKLNPYEKKIVEI